MIERLKAEPGILALQVRGHLSRDDIEQCLELLAAEFENHSKIGLFIEVAGLTGLDTETLALAFSRGLALLRQLDRFGRIAIVSDQTWIRWVSRLESALLPKVSYRTYTSAERKTALAWVQGASDLPYGNAVRVIATTRADAMAIEIDGRLAAEEVSQIVAQLSEKQRDQPIKAMLILIRSISGFDPSIAVDADFIRMKLTLPTELDRYAVVGGPSWLEAWLKFWQPLVHVELRHFDASEEAAAWNWLGIKPGGADAAAA